MTGMYTQFGVAGAAVFAILWLVAAYQKQQRSEREEFLAQLTTMGNSRDGERKEFLQALRSHAEAVSELTTLASLIVDKCQLYAPGTTPVTRTDVSKAAAGCGGGRRS